MFNNLPKIDTALALERREQGVGVRVKFKENIHRWTRTFPGFQVEPDEEGMMYATAPGGLWIVCWEKEGKPRWGFAFPQHLDIVEETV
jgi:hypothetical protein